MCCQQCFCLALQFEDKHHSGLLKMVADQLQCSPADIVDFELNVCDTQDGVIGGRLHRRLPDHSPVLVLLICACFAAHKHVSTAESQMAENLEPNFCHDWAFKEQIPCHTTAANNRRTTCVTACWFCVSC